MVGEMYSQVNMTRIQDETYTGDRQRNRQREASSYQLEAYRN